jgi:hypothetical protein
MNWTEYGWFRIESSSISENIISIEYICTVPVCFNWNACRHNWNQRCIIFDLSTWQYAIKFKILFSVDRNCQKLYQNYLWTHLVQAEKFQRIRMSSLVWTLLSLAHQIPVPSSNKFARWTISYFLGYTKPVK